MTIGKLRSMISHSKCLMPSTLLMRKARNPLMDWGAGSFESAPMTTGLTVAALHGFVKLINEDWPSKKTDPATRKVVSNMLDMLKSLEHQSMYEYVPEEGNRSHAYANAETLFMSIRVTLSAILLFGDDFAEVFENPSYKEEVFQTRLTQVNVWIEQCKDRIADLKELADTRLDSSSSDEDGFTRVVSKTKRLRRRKLKSKVNTTVDLFRNMELDASDVPIPFQTDVVSFEPVIIIPEERRLVRSHKGDDGKEIPARYEEVKPKFIVPITQCPLHVLDMVHKRGFLTTKDLETYVSAYPELGKVAELKKVFVSTPSELTPDVPVFPQEKPEQILALDMAIIRVAAARMEAKIRRLGKDCKISLTYVQTISRLAQGAYLALGSVAMPGIEKFLDHAAAKVRHNDLPELRKCIFSFKLALCATQGNRSASVYCDFTRKSRVHYWGAAPSAKGKEKAEESGSDADTTTFNADVVWELYTKTSSYKEHSTGTLASLNRRFKNVTSTSDDLLAKKLQVLENVRNFKPKDYGMQLRAGFAVIGAAISRAKDWVAGKLPPPKTPFLEEEEEEPTSKPASRFTSWWLSIKVRVASKIDKAISWLKGKLPKKTKPTSEE